MDTKQLLKNIRNTAVKLNQTYEKFEKQGIILDIFDDIYPELESAMAELLPNSYGFIQDHFTSFSADALLRLEVEADQLKGIRFGRNIRIQFKNGEERVLDRFEDNED